MKIKEFEAFITSDENTHEYDEALKEAIGEVNVILPINEEQRKKLLPKVWHIASERFQGDERHKFLNRVGVVLGGEAERVSVDELYPTNVDLYLEMLRALHTPKTNEALGEELGCSTTTISDRRGELADGVSLLDSEIKIDINRGGKMASTVHPIFLPLNMSEALCLVRALEQYTNEQRNENYYRAGVAEQLSGKVIAQLSEYAKDIIERNGGKDYRLPKSVSPSFTGNDTMSKAEPRDHPYFVMLEKEHALVRVEYNDEGDGDKRYIEGTIVGLRGNKWIIKYDGEEIRIPIDRVVDIAKFENK